MAGIFKYISEWISGNFPSDEETHRESMRSAKEAKARGSASHIEHIIDIFEDEVCDRYPGRTDIITTIKKFRQALYDEHGGVSPYSMLSRSKHFTPEGKIAFDKVVERCVWSLYPIASMYDTEAHAADTALAMQQWHIDKYGTPLD
ncbi:hypothetical protein H109_00719 [Trichophyton interdigitale MR816]|uniref:Uncharacterized protein n=1 Tax=Trichophyton interdigitale (strain MR816) TaxID=1215338 RepID=A0A059JI10_TRIIM|nr:hypothetical protein H101_04316 [Trichophyton interdigitale H6]KDB27505.1 hypothetical protein H109_00719 [Trichophyton interdigitale MR816]